MEKRESIYVNSGRAFFEEEKYVEAIKEFNKALFLTPDHFNANYLKALALCRLGRFEDALEPLRIVSEKEENYLIQQQANLISGYIFSMKNMVDKAINSFQRVIDAGLNASPAFNALGALYYKQGDIRKGIVYARRALELKSDNYNAMNTLGFILVDSEADIDKGLKFIKKSLEMDPNNPSRLDSMGWAYYKLRNFKLADLFLRKAYEKAPQEEEIRTHLGMLRAAME